MFVQPTGLAMEVVIIKLKVAFSDSKSISKLHYIIKKIIVEDCCFVKTKSTFYSSYISVKWKTGTD